MQRFVKIAFEMFPILPRGMNNEEKLLECEVCHKKMKESRTFRCQHSFCDSCLTDDLKNCNDDTCPTCSAKCEVADANKKQLPSAFTLCSICKKEEGSWFCQQCGLSFCSTCLEIHNKIEATKNHKVFLSKERLFCVDCEKMFEVEFFVLHAKHEVKKVSEFIKERVNKWKDHIKNIKANEVLGKNHIRIGQEKLMDEIEEILHFKEKVRCNYQELMQVLKSKEALEYETIDAYLSRMQKEYRGKIEKDILSLQKARSTIESKLEEIKKCLPVGFRDECPYELPQMHPHPNFKHHLSFQPIPKEALSHLQSCMSETGKKCTCQIIGICVAEKERILPMKIIQTFLQLDGNYVYARNSIEISIYSLKTLKLFKTVQWPKEITGSFSYILNIKERFYVVGVVDDTRRLMTFDEEGVKLHEFTLPSKFSCYSNGEAGKVLIIFKQNNVLSYHPVSREQELIPTPSVVDDIWSCCSMGGGEYCMGVRIKKEDKVVKVVDGNMVEVINVSGHPSIHSNSSGLLYILENDKKVFILDSNLDPICDIALEGRGSSYQLHVDDDCNIHVISWDSFWSHVVSLGWGLGRCYTRKYRMIQSSTCEC